MSRITKLLLGAGLVVSLYLVLPGPALPPPDLPESLKSVEPGDTIQLTNVSAYYTQKGRQEVIGFYRDYFSRSDLANFPLPAYRLNHPPEYARQVFVNTKTSYYIEEVVQPFRSSLFINGFEWEKDVFTPPSRRVKNKMVVGGETWASKVSLRWYPSRWATRLAIFWAGWGLLIFLIPIFLDETRAFIGFLLPKKK